MGNKPKTTKKLAKTTDTRHLRNGHPKKFQFVEMYRSSRGFIARICSALGMSRQTFYNWMKSDESFAKAIKEADDEINDQMKRKLISQAEDENNTTALIFYLKSKHPEFKPQRPDVQVNVQNNVDLNSYLK